MFCDLGASGSSAISGSQPGGEGSEGKEGDFMTDVARSGTTHSLEVSRERESKRVKIDVEIQFLSLLAGGK
eukprot:TRINITY_DN257_c0_g1_i1.p1 TRINITY_DN257_c0_g1~~TRINITY_DN257_c0_g1_i1.p1  ORF type:complete len:71 (-),score=16.60 TRINITY_DN257_c0_g1_i1:256-468(-)